MNNEGYFDKTADTAIGNSNLKGKSSFSPSTVYAKFKELPVSKQYKVIKYKGGGPNSIILTLDNKMQLRFAFTRKGWLLEAI